MMAMLSGASGTSVRSITNCRSSIHSKTARPATAAGDRGRSSRKRCFHGPLADEHLQALHRGTPGGVVQFHGFPPGEAMIQGLTIADRAVARKSSPRTRICSQDVPCLVVSPV